MRQQPHTQRAEAARVYPSLVRPVLIGDAEREPMVVMIGLVAALVAAFRPNVPTYSLAVALLVFGVPALRRLARRDPQWFRVARRHVHLAGHYRPRAAHDAPRGRVSTL